MKKRLLKWLGIATKEDLVELHKTMHMHFLGEFWCEVDKNLEAMLLTPETSQWRSANALVIQIRQAASRAAKSAIQNDLPEIVWAIKDSEKKGLES